MNDMRNDVMRLKRLVPGVIVLSWLCGGAAELAGGIRYLLIVLFAGCVWPLTFWGFSRLGRR